MAKYQPYSRRVLRALFRRWAAHHRKFLAAVCVVTVVVLVAETDIFTAFWHLPERAYLLGLIRAGLIASIAHLVHTSFVASNREAIWHLRRAWGEENTRGELQRAKRKGLVWGSIDSVNIGTGDIDHLIVTRDGGLVVLDSKWRTESVTDPSGMVRSAEKVKMRAEAVARTLLGNERGSHRAAVTPCP
ncbi:NERD domain-containing protein [Aeromicrobium wangtongii]|uniref:NERD domain-containing protein n=1 Tax=Aeromicrobium wangtongii TaxID=2969247 RepID=A0ABY5M6P8_9ACTN|nr:NERD domain-containing protein [Aeromicrobium wangtongii]MCD9198342.1 NERD domain-containing protein [Aeromicrobium wangtongii]UUP12373.1 NERD domain-containing protein [Aeromicrobium wangtongii]